MGGAPSESAVRSQLVAYQADARPMMCQVLVTAVQRSSLVSPEDQPNMFGVVQ